MTPAVEDGAMNTAVRTLCYFNGLIRDMRKYIGDKVGPVTPDIVKPAIEAIDKYLVGLLVLDWCCPEGSQPNMPNLVPFFNPPAQPPALPPGGTIVPTSAQLPPPPNVSPPVPPPTETPPEVPPPAPPGYSSPVDYFDWPTCGWVFDAERWTKQFVEWYKSSQCTQTANGYYCGPTAEMLPPAYAAYIDSMLGAAGWRAWRTINRYDANDNLIDSTTEQLTREIARVLPAWLTPATLDRILAGG
jgi:hypothetical protein